MVRSPTGPGSPAQNGADPAVSAMLSSLAFRRSRRSAEAMCDDADAIADLMSRIRALPLVNQDLAATLESAHPLLDRAESVAADPGCYDRLTPAEQARHRLVIAAAHYVVQPHDVIPDGHVGGSIDDLLVLLGVLGAVRHAHGDAAPA